MNKKIMVVDDEADIVDLLTVILESEGYDVFSAKSGQECLEKLKEIKPDLILLDIMMKPIDGWETLRALKNNKNLKNIPVSMLTVKKITNETLVKEEIEQIESYIQKPFSKEELLQKIKEILYRTDKVQNTVKKLEREIGEKIAIEYEELLKRINRHKSIMTSIKKLSAIEKKETNEIEIILKQEAKLISILERKMELIESQIKRSD